MYTRDTEIRHMSSADVFQLAQLLDPNNSWKKLMQIIPKDFQSKSPEDMIYKYNNDHVRLVENASMKQNRMATEILFDEWGTSGKKRPTLGVLLELLVKAELFRAADLVALNFLNEPPPARPTKGPAAKVDINIPLDSEFINNVEAMLNEGNSNSPGTETLNDNVKANNSAGNNIDYYEKYHRNQKRIDIPQSPPTSNESNNPIRPSSDNGVRTPEPSLPSLSPAPPLSSPSQRGQQPPSQPQSNPIHSDLMKFSAATMTDSQAIPVFSELLSPDVPSAAGISLANIESSTDIPMLSALNTQQSSAIVSQDMLPDISVLNVGDVELDDDKLKPPEEGGSLQSSSSVSSLSSTTDDGDLSAPNLSILDQRSSNNDSSLTNVTGTSEENSFEMSIPEGSASNDNIPCLSVLK